jgi:N6-L-threonylcarbamoyladenine synthase
VILAFETSCDDTCAALVDERGEVLANVISSQAVHERFGGVVPEIASRHHLELIEAVLAGALGEAGASLEQVSLVAATRGPGLVGALLVGLSFAKGLACARGLPFAGVDHLQGHVAANFLEESFEPPFVCLIASGGHTLLAEVREHDGYELLGSTLDDAAGEAFDKGARMLGLGYPGGAALEELARGGDPELFPFAVPGDRGRAGRGKGRQAFAQSLDFSFAGLKTALLLRVRELSPADFSERRADLAASYQQAILDSLLARAEQALERTGLERLAIGGGVARNGPLRRRLAALGASVHIPAPVLCTDNAAMIASAARFGEVLEYPAYLGVDAYASGERPL